MRNNIFKTAALSLGILSGIVACSPDDPTLGGGLTESQIESGFIIYQDSDDPNMVIMVNKLNGFTPMWTTPQGRSQRMQDTVKIAFPGVYEFTFGVLTDAGYQSATPVSLNITTTNLGYVDDPMWTNLTGGVGKSKIWVPDNGAYGTKQGFYSCFDPSATYIDMMQDEDNQRNWYPNGLVWWEPSNNDVGVTADDLKGYMEFKLDGGAFLTTTTYVGDVETVTNGKFNLNVSNMTMSAVDVDLHHGLWAHDKAVDFRNGFQVLVLTEDILMIANYRDEGLSGEGRCIYAWNFVSKEYADAYVPPATGPIEPSLPDNWLDDISQTTSTKVTWKLSEENPLDWAGLDGSMKNGFNSPSDYPDWLGTPDPGVYGGFSMTLDAKYSTAVFVTPDGATVECEYSLSEKGIYSFTEAVPTFTLINWASFGADANNQLRILKVEKDPYGDVSGMWIGALEQSNEQYVAYHLIPSIAGGGSSDNVKTLEVNNTNLLYGHMEENTNEFRIDLYNEWGDSKNNPAINPADVVFNSRLEVTFKLSGIEYAEGAAGVYDAVFSFVNSDWSIEIWGNGSGNTKVRGDGTYKVYIDGASGGGVTVCLIDIKEMWPDLVNPENIQAEVVSVKLY